jgi:hypothetical protein
MDGYDVITFDDEKAGHVVGRSGSYLVVEHGAIFKHRRPVPATFATVDDDARVVRLTVSKEILESAPEVREGVLDEQAAGQHYGLVAGPRTPDDDRLDGMLSNRDEFEQMERAESMTRLGRGQGPNDAPLPSPGMSGGDRRRDAD